MRKVHVDKVEPGTRLAKAVFTADGRILLTTGMKLRANFIEKLKMFGITEVYIDDEISRGINVRDVINEQTRLETKILIKQSMEEGILKKSINTAKIIDTIERIINELLSNEEIIINMLDIKTVDDYTFEHSVNVCVLSLIMGLAIGFNMARLMDLGIGALLHDIGKLRVSEELLKKPSTLTDEEFDEIKKHTVYGYEILKDNPNVSSVSAFIAFSHHERIDGSGYPLGLRNESIHQCARIVAVADVYDALTSDRVYRSKLKPHEAVEYITSLAGKDFDREIVHCFRKYVALYPVGTGVLLNMGYRGIVTAVNADMPERPVIRVIYDENGRKMKHYYEIDLSKRKDISIKDVCEL